MTKIEKQLNCSVCNKITTHVLISDPDNFWTKLMYMGKSIPIFQCNDCNVTTYAPKY